ncbi:hypothetical protein CBW65_03630 [Tumebacillus avium]|uniref:Polyketide synthase n=1 Tax=Tumebacillus avium TaxID=1903704 RepID=A0A1Y0ILF0_9BACL|nr:SDR family NAD(P)-dependent oxidoreductase [Tumebacillus avium]ARU60253.1 hypothetical protein CBW65_03630 [Tumebacillus avium]
MKNIYKFVVENINAGKIEKQTAVEMIKMLKEEEVNTSGDIAVIGMAADLPLANTLEDYWSVIENGIDAIRQFPDSRRADIDVYLKSQGRFSEDTEYSEGAYLDHIDKFDCGFFRISPKEASMMDPAQRLFLETVWAAIEDAGYGGQKLAGTNTGVYVGFANNLKDSYGKVVYDSTELDSSSIVGNLTALIPSRISFHLDLKGPTMVIDTACSSSLVSISLAVQALRSGQCSMAIAGGIRLSTVPTKDDSETLGIESADGRTRAFDDRSDGAGVGEGVAAVLLKPLQEAMNDGDHIYAVIKGVAVNQDGSSIGITAPNPAAQTDVIVKAWEDAKIDPATISYIETHGTGTNLGDPIEVKGIQNAFRRYTNNTQFCALSSVKTNIGHLFEAAGAANFIKAVLALQNKKIPAALHFNKPNRTIDFGNSPVYVNNKLRDWDTPEGQPRRCGVSSFGISGTNAHIVLEEAPKRAPLPVPAEPSTAHLLTLSAKTEGALERLVAAYRTQLQSGTELALADICFTANTGRGHYTHRLALVVNSLDDLRNKLDAWQPQGTRARGVFYGQHKIVPKGRDVLGENEMTEGDLHALTRQTAEFLQEKADELWQSRTVLDHFCKLYTAGAEIDWTALYAGREAYRLPLPTYPFELTRCWLDISLDAAAEQEPELDLYYTMNWVPGKLNAPADAEMKLGTVLIFADQMGLGAQLAAEYRAGGRACIMVEAGVAFEQLAPNHFVIGSREEDYHLLFETLQHEPLSQIVHLFAKTGQTGVGSLSDLTASQQRGLYSAFYLTRALMNNNFRDNLDIVLIADYASEVSGTEPLLKPENASLFGIGKVVSLEYPHLKCRCLDLDDEVSVETLLAELNATGTLYQVAYRDGGRYEEQFTEVDLPAFPDHPIEMKADGVYLITGGTGGIGLEIAKHFASKGKINLALLSRSGMPDRSEWAALQSTTEDKKLRHKLSFIEEIEANGTTVDCYAANVADADELQSVLVGLRSKYGKINGVLHAAGIPGDGYLVRKEHAVFDEVVAPKIQGTWILDQLTQADELDFFLIFSSGIAILGEAGQGDYVPANAYKDAYAAYRNKQGRLTTTFDWTSWKSAGMSVEYGFNVDLIFKSIPTEQAIKGFDEVLNKQIPRVLIGELNYKSQYMALLETLSFHISPKTQLLLDQTKALLAANRPQASEQKKRSGGKGEIRLIGKDGEITAVEKTVAQIYRDILGFDEINVHDSFFELGGDSLMLNKMHAQLDQEFPGKVKVADLFAHTSISKLSEFIGNDEAAEKLTIGERANEISDDDIAVIGLAVDMPMAGNADEFWANIAGGLDSIKPFPDHRAKTMNEYLLFEGEKEENLKYLKGAYLDNIDEFDYKFFKLSPKEAALTDPHQRLFMKTIYHAIEDAGYGGTRLAGSNTGVYVGFASSLKDSYQRMINEIDPELLPISAVGNIAAMIPSRITYFLDLKGPAMVIDTACSSTLVAIHAACRDIKNGDCEAAIVAGARISLAPLDREYMKIGIESATGYTMTFDNQATGSGLGEGAAAVLLKPLKQALADGDQVYAVIKGSAYNQDGTSMGITAPNPAAQESVLVKAWQRAGVHPETLSFIEAHGTATPLGDPIEIDALQKAFQKFTDKTQFCAIGAVKSNIGHLYEAAGITAFVKSVLAIKNKQIPPSIHFERPNPKISFTDSPVYVNTRTRPYENADVPMRAGVSSWGFSGTNAHIVLEAAPVREKIGREQGLQVFTLSAKGEYSFETLIADYRTFLRDNPDADMLDICFTASTGRDHSNHRLAILLREGEHLADKLASLQLDGGSQTDIFHGFHRVVSEPQDSAAAITERDRAQLSGEAREKLFAYLDSGRQDVQLLEELCALYVRGADVDWIELYQDLPAQRISLPLYPYEPNPCWLEVPEGRKQRLSDKPDQFFTIAWKPETLASAATRTVTGGVLLFQDGKGIGEQLAARYRAENRLVITVELGQAYRKLSDQQYVITGSEADYFALADAVKAIELDKIVHLFAVQAEEVNSLESLEANQEIGLYSLFRLVRGLAAAGIERELDIVTIAEYTAEVTGAEPRIRPENATMFGMGKVVRKEHPNLITRCIDIDEQTPLEALYAELEAEHDLYQVAYRSGARFIEEFTEVDADRAEDRPLQVKEDGVYVITGGAGGIGLEVARYLASQNLIHLVLLNRSKMPAAEEWGAILEAGQDERTIEKIRNLQSIEALGGTVTCYSVSVADREALAAVLSEVRSKWGKIDGVIHGAGVGGAEPIVTRSQADFDAVFTPKVQGTWNLDELTREDNLDFLVLFSSIASMFSMPGQGDYIAANSYLDSYASYRNKLGLRTITVNWSTWRETGMSVQHNFNIDTLFKAIMTREAIEGLDKILNKGVPRALIGEVNYDSKIIFLLEKSAFRLSNKIGGELGKRTSSTKARLKKAKGSPAGEVVLVGNDSGEYAETEKRIAEICQETLGFSEINIYDNFFELGADSILLTRMHTLLDKEWPGVIAVTDIFEYTSIYKLAQYIKEKDGDQAAVVPEEKPDIEDALRNIFDNLENDDVSLEEALNSLKDI